MVFANIEYLFLLLLLIPYIVWYIMRRRNNEATLQISDLVYMLIRRRAIRTICCMCLLCYGLLPWH